MKWAEKGAPDQLMEGGTDTRTDTSAKGGGLRTKGGGLQVKGGGLCAKGAGFWARFTA